MSKKRDTSWHSVTPWYSKLVGTDGHYYHEHTVLPGVIRLLNLAPTNSLVDLGCGQGILSRAIPKISHYLGIDSAPGLISEAKKQNSEADYSFVIKDLTKLLPSPEKTFSHAVFILSLQNMDNAAIALKNAARFLDDHGKLVVVLNHPCFRIPRQSGWGVDEKAKQQYRWVNRYLSSIKIPITMNPGTSQSKVTWSFHHSLQEYVSMLSTAGFVITEVEEWTSDKESAGKVAKMENRARAEFPLFLTIVAQKLHS